MTSMKDFADLDPAQQQFLQQVVLGGHVWGLRDAEGWALSPSAGDEDVLVFPLWSSEAAARACAGDDWAAYEPESVPLDELLEHWLPGMHQDGYLVGTDWDPSMEGVEVPPLELQADLEAMIIALDEDGALDAGTEERPKH
ncbi:MAG: DUF2750 domain-containing protein [Ectothiorhodospiraceae bacterium]|nr:DUF2750 domain-containing protein [Ectothiorhodospiraceae bacterium]